MSQHESSAVTVVLADDEAHVRSYLEVLLHDEGFVVVGTASDANGVVQLAHQVQPDVAVIDLRMPGSGVEAVRLITTVSPETRLVVFTADADGDDELFELLRAGIDGYVLKGSDPGEIGRAIRSAVSGGTVMEPDLNRRALDALTDRLDAEAMAEAQRRRVQDRVDAVIARKGFTVFHQPIVHIATGTTHAVEALTRFAPSTRSTVDWFRDADATGRGTALEVATIAAALADLPRLRPEVALTLNVSPETVVAGRLAELLGAQPLHRIVLELTEHAEVADVRVLARALAPWRERGVLLAIDDTGSGHSSFAHVLAMRPDLVKLDGAIVQGVEHDSPRRSLVRAVVSFADDEGLGLVAEGVETAEQLAIVAELGVPYAQGFHTGRPRPLHEQPELLADPSDGSEHEVVISLRDEALLRRGR